MIKYVLIINELSHSEFTFYYMCVYIMFRICSMLYALTLYMLYEFQLESHLNKRRVVLLVGGFWANNNKFV